MTQRIVTGTLLIIALAAVLFLGGWYFAAAAFVAVTLCIYEELRAFRQCGKHPVSWTSYVALAVSVPLMMYYSSVVIIPTLTIMSFFVLLVVMRREEPNLTDVMVSVLPMLTLVLPGMCLFGILDTSLRRMQAMLLTMVFAIAVGGDTFALFVGTWIGGKKLCPKISPHKTVAGAIGGLVGSILLAWLVGYVFATVLPTQAFPPMWANIVVGFVGGVAAQMGDLFASMVKRYCGIKDFGTLFPGHGGMLDRMDSILFAAIIVYSYRVVVMTFIVV
ncbi:MAG TPA: CDP-archaeol synthase [Candidatus Limiplasma sp.]|nr:CDP-archaeol synthase [Candidatus Limiplasma sp.]HPS81678.1 CDP-archaeol synthase [Candidatus Limiplasma sp.]